jgi:HrpA-like RNA helicase
LLQLKAIGVQNVSEFDFIDKPDVKLIEDSLTFLKSVGALEEPNVKNTLY